tara:strand:+ start:1245 stop:1763 length:519 start_codon:yes stop_codon:yes gene_type:complete
MNNWTQSIGLEAIAPSQFRDFERRWVVKPFRRGNFLHSQVINPLTSERYEDLVEQFCDRPFVYRINVRHDGLWKRVYKSQFNSELVRSIAECARGDPIQDNHFEMKFLLPENRGTGAGERAYISFAERNGLIVGYRVGIHMNNADLFDVKFVTPREFAYGIADSETPFLPKE